MLVTLTPNPSLDLLFEAGTPLVWDDANRVPVPRRRPGGQGINVVRAARALGGVAVAVAPLGGATGRELRETLEAEGTPLEAVAVACETRVFVAVAERPTGRSMLLNPRGEALSGDEAEALRAAVRAAVARHRPAWLASCGSLPPGLDPDYHASIGAEARRAGVRFVADCDGEALCLAAEAGCDLLVPNRHEAERLLGCGIPDTAAAAEAARALLGYGAELGVVTLEAEGAVLATSDGVWHAAAPPADGVAVGAGDALLAGLLLALMQKAAPPDALRAAVAAGTAVLGSVGAGLVDRRRYEAARREVRLERVG